MNKESKFKPGQSGNPKGRPKGVKDRRTAYRGFFETESESLIKKVIDLAKEGDTTCLKMCIDRIVSPYRPKEYAVTVNGLQGTLTEKGNRIIEAMGAGEISPSDASAALSALAAQARIVEVEELEARLSKLESKT